MSDTTYKITILKNTSRKAHNASDPIIGDYFFILGQHPARGLALKIAITPLQRVNPRDISPVTFNYCPAIRYRQSGVLRVSTCTYRITSYVTNCPGNCFHILIFIDDKLYFVCI